MKKILIILFAAFVIASCSPAPVETSMAVQVPSAINDAIAVGITALLALGTGYVFNKLGLDLRQFTAPVAITVSAWVVGELQNIVNTVPETADPWLDFLFKVIVLLIAPVGLLAFRVQPSNPERLL